jgi:hypothetical protein
VKLKLHREAVVETERPEPGASLRFPARAVRDMPAPGWRQDRTSNGVGSMHPVKPREDRGMNYQDVIRGIEATLDRMQGTVNELHEQVENFKFPSAGGAPSDRPRAA